jgi:hypothetical protein
VSRSVRDKRSKARAGLWASGNVFNLGAYAAALFNREESRPGLLDQYQPLRFGSSRRIFDHTATQRADRWRGIYHGVVS